VQQVEVALKGLGKLQRRVLDVVNEFAQAQTDGIEVEAVVQEVLRKHGLTDQRNAARNVRRALTELCDREDVNYSVQDGVLSIT
jgi:homoserine dehydrogenase